MPPSNPKSKASSSSTRQPLTRGLSTPSRPSSGPFHPRFGPFYARFQPILGTQKCFPRDFRDQFSKFPKISWLGELFFKIVSRILGGAKGRFCPVAGGGGRFVSPCLSAVAVSCPAVWACARSGSARHRRRAARSGSLQADTTGPARLDRPGLPPGISGPVPLLLYGISGPARSTAL